MNLTKRQMDIIMEGRGNEAVVRAGRDTRTCYSLVRRGLMREGGSHNDHPANPRSLSRSFYLTPEGEDVARRLYAKCEEGSGKKPG